MTEATVVEETFKRLSSHRGVVGVMVVTADGVPIRSNLDNTLSVQYGALVSRLSSRAKSVVAALDKTKEDSLKSIRIRSRKYEIVIALDAEQGQGYHLVVLQDPSIQ